jgi:hypothetical protein
MRSPIRWVSKVRGVLAEKVVGVQKLVGPGSAVVTTMPRRAAAGGRVGWIQFRWNVEGGGEKESADKPGSVVGNHSSAIRVAAYLKRPTREPVRATHCDRSEDRSARSPIWSCSRRGLPCRRVLPPARCALTAPFHPYRRAAEAARLGGMLSVALSVDSRPPGVTWRLALGARTFLHPCKQGQRLPGRLRHS